MSECDGEDMGRGTVLFEREIKLGFFAVMIGPIGTAREKRRLTIYQNGIDVRYYTTNKEGKSSRFWDLGFIPKNTIATIYEISIPDAWNKKNIRMYQIETTDMKIIHFDATEEEHHEIILALKRMIGDKWKTLFSTKKISVFDIEQIQHTKPD